MKSPIWVVPLFEVGVVLGVMFFTGVLQTVVKVSTILLIDIGRSQVCTPTKPPLFSTWGGGGEKRKKETRVIIHYVSSDY